MIAPQISAYPASGRVRRFHSTPASAAMAAPVSTRLMVQALGDEVKDHESGRKGGDRHGKDCQTTGIDDRLSRAHASRYGAFLSEVQHG